jgi:hypothetical protein
MANELDELYSSMNDSNKQLKTFESILAQNARSTSILDNSFKASTEAAKASKAAQDKMAKTISGTISGLTSFSKGLVDGKGSFAPLQTAISLTTKALGGFLGMFGKVGKALKGVVDGAGEVANFMVEQFDKAYGTFEKLSDSGVVSSFEDMKTSARSMGLTMADQEQLLVKRSKDLALFAGSAVRGREEFQKMAVASNDIREQFQTLGISNQEYADMQLGYLNREMMAGRGQTATTEQLIKGSTEYIKELDTISKLTGASRKDIQAEREARMSEARYRAGVATLPKEIRENADKYLDLMSKSGAKGISKVMGELIASDGRANTREQGNLITAYRSAGIDITKIAKGIRNGSIEASAGFDQIAAGSKAAELKFRELAKLKGQDLAVTEKYVEFFNLGLKSGKNQLELEKEWQDQQAKIMADKDSDNAKLAKTKQALYNSSVNIEQLATEGKLVTGSMKYMADGIETITEKLYKMAGEDLPPYLKARSDERKAIEAASKAEKDLLAIEKQEVAEDDPLAAVTGGPSNLYIQQTKLDDARKKLEDAIKERESAKRRREKEDEKSGISPAGAGLKFSGPGSASQKPQPPGAGEMRSSPDMSGGKPELTTIRSKDGKSTQVNKKAAPQFQKLLDWFGQAGYAINSLGGYNDRNIAGTNTPSWHSNGEAIDINPSKNPYGSKPITDMPPGTGQAAASLGLGWGLNWPNVKDAMHFSTGPNEGGRLQARTGGIFSGPESGYLATLHGDEAVVDVGNESVQHRALNSSVLGGTGNQSETDFNEVYREMENKLDKLIDLMDMNVGNQRKQLKEKMG